MFDVGDAVPLEVAPLSGGNPVDVTGLAVSLTLPDGSTAGPYTPVHNALGSYTYTYTTVQAGRHVVRWTGTGWADSSVFNVWPADPRFLFSLDDAKATLRAASMPSSDDETLRLYIAAATPVIEDIVGPLLGGAKTLTVDGGTNAIVLPWSQGATVTGITENGVATTLTWTLDPAVGVIYAGDGYGPRQFARGWRNVVVTYTTSGVIPPNVLLAAREEFRFLWQIGQQANRSSWGDQESEMSFTPSGFAVPRRVIELCAPHMRPPRVA